MSLLKRAKDYDTFLAYICSTLILELQKFQNNSPQNFREPLAYRSYPKCLSFTFVLSLPLFFVGKECLEAQQSVDAFDHSDIAVPPVMEEVLDSRHILIGSGSK